MKTLSLILSLLMSISAYAVPQGKSLSVSDFVKTMDAESEPLVPKKFKSLLVEDFKADNESLFFTIKGFPIHLEIIKDRKTAIKLNGVPFSKDELKNFKSAKYHFLKKFNLSEKRFSLLNLFVSEAHAVYVQANIPESVARSLINAGYQVRVNQNNGFYEQRRYPNMASLLAAINASGGSEGAALMSAIMGAANAYKPPYEPSKIEPFRLRNNESAS